MDTIRINKVASKKSNRKNKILLVVLLPFFACLLFNLISAVTISNTLISSVGLNSSINVTFLINFDQVDISDNSITFYNLTYLNPSSCNSQTSSYTVYNFTSANTIQILPSTCVIIPSNSGDTIYPEINYTNSTNLTIENKVNTAINTTAKNITNDIFYKIGEKLIPGNPTLGWFIALGGFILLIIVIASKILNRK